MTPVAVRVGVVDSGINPAHPHVSGVEGGVGIRYRDSALETDDSWEDRIGHGTAVAATIRAHAPSAHLYSIRIFRRRLVAHLEALLYALDWAVSREMNVVNLSLGCETDRQEKRRELSDACRRAHRAGVLIVVAASESSALKKRSGPNEVEHEPLPDVLPVAPDPELQEGELRFDDARGIAFASPWARHLGELPKERNVHGASLAVAHASGLVARCLADGLRSPEDTLSPIEWLQSAGSWTGSPHRRILRS